MNAKEAKQYIEDNGKWGSRPGLSRIDMLLDRLDRPDKDLDIIHVAGTNGKGSVCMMCEAILRAAGFVTGLFTSPALLDFSERIRIDGKSIDDKRLARAVEIVKTQCDQMVKDGYEHPTGFEIETAVALIAFQNADADIVILETGMGGRMDATNAVKNPVACVITHIALDHTEWLGSTVAEIAAEKAAIIKPGAIAVTAKQDPSAFSVIRKKAAEVGAPLYSGCDNALTCLNDSLEGQRLCLTSPKDKTGQNHLRLTGPRDKRSQHHNENNLEAQAFTLSLLGAHQRDNASCVLALIDGLNQKGCDISQTAVAKGMAAVSFPGRFEIIQKKPPILIDGAHNPDGAKAFANNIKHYFKTMPVHLYIGMLGDKDVDSVLMTLLPIADTVTVLTPLNDRAMSAEILADKIKSLRDVHVTIARSVDEAVEHINDDGCLHAFTGSLYLIGHVRNAVLTLGKSKEQRQSHDCHYRDTDAGDDKPAVDAHHIRKGAAESEA